MKKNFLAAFSIFFTLAVLVYAGVESQNLQGRFSFSSFAPSTIPSISFSTSSGTTYYASPNAFGSGTSFKDPIGLEMLLSGPDLQDGDHIQLTGGTYTPRIEFYIQHDVSITGVQGQTIFDCSGFRACIFIKQGKTVDMSTFEMINHRFGIFNNDATLNIENAYFHSPDVTTAYAPSSSESSILFTGSQANGSVSNSTFEDDFASHQYEMQSIRMEHGGTANIFNNTFENEWVSIFDDEGGDSEIYNNSFSGTLNALNINGEASRKIYNNTFENHWNAMDLQAIGDTVIHNNQFTSTTIGMLHKEAWSYYGSFTGDHSRAQIYNNLFTNLTTAFSTGNGDPTQTDHAVFYENEISYCTTGIEAAGIDHTLFERNHIHNCQAAVHLYENPFYQTQPTNTVENNLIESNNRYGIYLSGANATVAFNTIVNGNKGVITDQNDKSLIANNNVTNNRNEGYLINSSSSELAYNNAFTNGTNYSGTYIDLGGNLMDDPHYRSGGFELGAISPLIDAAGHYLTSQDYYGTTRTIPDKGAFEF